MKQAHVLIISTSDKDGSSPETLKSVVHEILAVLRSERKMFLGVLSRQRLQ